jgi:hypothetical protein
MFCPACNTQNSAMATHCFQCRTQLILLEQDRSPEVKSTMRKMDYRIYGGIGFAVFSAIGFVVFQSGFAAVFFGFAGGVIGRYIVHQKAKGL